MKKGYVLFALLATAMLIAGCATATLMFNVDSGIFRLSVYEDGSFMLGVKDPTSGAYYNIGQGQIHDVWRLNASEPKANATNKKVTTVQLCQYVSHPNHVNPFQRFALDDHGNAIKDENNNPVTVYLFYNGQVVKDKNGNPVIIRFQLDDHGNAIKDMNGNPVSDPVVLDGNGNAIKDENNNPVPA